MLTLLLPVCIRLIHRNFIFSEDEPDVDLDIDDESEDFEAVTVDPAELFVPLRCDNHSETALPTSFISTSTLTSSVSTSQPTLPLPQPQRVITPPNFTCKCSHNNGDQCWTAFSTEEIDSFKLQYIALTREELDICILSKLSCFLHVDPMTKRPKQKEQTVRKSSRADYFHHGHRICRDFFMYLHGIGKDKLTALIKAYKLNGVEPRNHKNSKKAPAHALLFRDTRNIVDFIINYAEVHSIQLPGRTPTHWKSDDVKLLPTNCTKKTVYDEYVKAATNGNYRVVKISLFCNLWNKVLPHIRTMPPASDLCWLCQKGTAKVIRSANKPDKDKDDALNELRQHQDSVKKERAFYKDICHDIKAQLPLNIQPGAHEPCSFAGKNHISFDFAQQVHFPFNPLQPGPIYFKTPRKCGLFGINCEPINKQVNFLIDEAHTVGKGANSVISYLHHYLNNFSFGETDLYMHADNCAGQNKNSTMLWYLLWRCINGYNNYIRLSFLISGHTKFSPDGGFGLIKRLYKRTRVNCLQDIVDVVNRSSEMNMAEVVGYENETSKVPTYNWTEFLSPVFQKFKGIKKYCHFAFSKDGIIRCQLSVDSEEESYSLLRKNAAVPSDLPPVIPTDGLNLKRQWYLYQEIRPFIDEEFQDTVAPKPANPQPAVQEEEADEEDEETAEERPTKRRKTTKGRTM